METTMIFVFNTSRFQSSTIRHNGTAKDISLSKPNFGKMMFLFIHIFYGFSTTCGHIVGFFRPEVKEIGLEE